MSKWPGKYVIGLTGNIATGKSVVRRMLEHLGAYTIDADALSIIEGALAVSEMQVRDIMIPRAQMDVIDINEPVEQFMPQVISSAHSRFPVIGQNRDDVIGVLLARR
mgnify:CR=1 FL=1